MKLCIFILLLIIFSGCVKNSTIQNFHVNSTQDNSVSNLNSVKYTSTTSSPSTTIKKPKIQLFFPINQFKDRITKKPFGIYITPKTSPIQPERFTGYHAGVDVEYADSKDVIPVFAITDGTVLYSGWVSGYGGVIIIQYLINNRTYQALYGHLNPNQLPKKDKKVIGGEQIGILGNGDTHETDGERKHLHFSIYTGTNLNYKGYVQTQNELSLWINPLSIY